MKKDYEFFKTPDHDFDLMTVSDEELFFALKNAVVGAINDLPEWNEVGSDDIHFDGENATRRKVYGKDGNLYPYIVLPFSVKDCLGVEDFYLLLNSFEVSLLSTKNGVQIVTNKNLSRVFAEYMQSRFQESCYAEKRKTYFRVAETIRKIEDGELFS